MKVCTHDGLDIAVLTRNEHCPPHVHVGTEKWDARFEFSFWHDGVRLWDVTPEQNEPKAAILEDLRQALKLPVNLRRAREHWWYSRSTVCLDNQLWDTKDDEIVAPKDKRPNAKKILSARFDKQRYRTVLLLAGAATPLEIEL